MSTRYPFRASSTIGNSSVAKSDHNVDNSIDTGRNGSGQQSDVICWSTSMTFVDSMWQIWAGLSCPLAVPTVIASKKGETGTFCHTTIVIGDARAMDKLLRDYGVTHVVMVPSVWQTIVNLAWFAFSTVLIKIGLKHQVDW